MVLLEKLKSIPVSNKYAKPPDVFIAPPPPLPINELNFKAKYLCFNAVYDRPE